MRVLHIAQSISGGIASYFEEIAEYQARHFGPDAVRFLIPAGNRHHLPLLPPSQITEFSPCDRSARGLLALGLATHREVCRFEPTIVHLHSTFAGAIARPTLMLSRRRPKVVYCAHGWVFAMEIPKWKRKLFAWIEKGLLLLTDAVVNISHSDHRLAQSYGFRTTKMTTIRNAIAATRAIAPTSISAFPKNQINLIFVGRHDRQKGLDFLLETFAAAAVPGVHLHVVGAPVVDNGEELQRPRLANVTFHGWQPRSAVDALIAASDALVMPSRWEGFGLVALEAMRLGKPVLASTRGALGEIVEHGRTGLLFGMEQPAELREILVGLDKRTLAHMGENARAAFLGSFTADRMNGELAVLYRKLSGRASQTQPRVWMQRKDTPQKVWPNE
jgi:glycosyltransferase involved in cell wall biosynthesis